ncbi:MAG TPA: hypothetical protein VK716_03835 [Terracidiphilus sp.]|jgi:hypothetical protein|nr:hypothetical protein [Terracidiphilus sp.]
MAQKENSTNSAPALSAVLEAKNERLQALVGELLNENQELRFKMHLIERKAKALAGAVEESSGVYGLLLP